MAGVTSNNKANKKLFRIKKIGRIDFVALDHIHQIELMYKDKGNVCVQTFNSTVKTWRNSENELVSGILVCQTNREGVKRAAKRGGQYDLQAIGDLNECATSSTSIYATTEKGEEVKTFGSVVSRANKESLYVDSVDYSSGKLIKTKVKKAFVAGKVDDSFEWRKLTLIS